MRALLVVDVQNDFCEGGSLAVDGGVEVAQSITAFLANHDYAHVVATKDYHIDPGSHFSATPDFIDSWPPHCVVGTPGVEFHPAFDPSAVEAVFHKGQYSAAYSGFEGNHADDETPLAQWLRAQGVDAVDVIGIATDYCVKATAMDAIAEGFAARVLLGLTAGIHPETIANAVAEMRSVGVDVA
jgi:nicotinamidase/pyrazinamidase